MANPQKENGYTAISNELLDALIGVRIPGEARQVLDMILRKTYGFHKKEDSIALSQFCLATRMNKRAVIRAIHRLFDMNLIGVKKDTYATTKYRVNKDFDTWKLVSKKTHTKDTLKDTSTKDIERAQKYFYLKYKEVFKKDYVADFGKDGKIFKDLEKIVPGEEIKLIIDKFFNLNDEFIKEAGHTTGVLRAQINKLREGIYIQKRTTLGVVSPYDKDGKVRVDKIVNSISTPKSV
jgi:phage replication O-like protein O